VTARTPRPESAALTAARLRHGAGMAALSVLYAHRNRFVQFTTRAIAERTDYSVSVIGGALTQAARLRLVERDMTTVAPRVPYWRLTVTGCEFVRKAAGQ
jgi:hypothetical protein